MTMFAVASSQIAALNARPAARVAARGKPRAARVVTRAASEVETVLFITNDKGEFVRAGSTASTLSLIHISEPTRPY